MNLFIDKPFIDLFSQDEEKSISFDFRLIAFRRNQGVHRCRFDKRNPIEDIFIIFSGSQHTLPSLHVLKNEAETY